MASNYENLGQVARAGAEPINDAPANNATAPNDHGIFSNTAHKHEPDPPQFAYIRLEDLPSVQGGQRPANAAPIRREQGARMVTPLERLGVRSADVDCDKCQRIVRTKVVNNPAEVSGLMMCLVCLICPPLLCCLDSLNGDEGDIDHFCSLCGQHLTHKSRDGPVSVVAKVSPNLVYSIYN